MVGDGAAGVDARAGDATGAEAVGLRLLASGTIASTVHSRGARHKGKRRPEHTLLFEAV